LEIVTPNFKTSPIKEERRKIMEDYQKKNTWKG